MGCLRSHACSMTHIPHPKQLLKGTQVAEAAARAEDCLLTHRQALDQGMRLGIDGATKTVTALPLLLPNYMPNQAGLPSLLAGLADILQQPGGGAQDVEGIAEVCNVRILHVQICAPAVIPD